MATPLPAPRSPRPVLESVDDFKPTQVELAYGRIWAGIVRGRIAAGTRLVESRVAEELAMSRTPVREAIRRLEAEGLVDAEPNKGAVVRQLTVDDVADLYDLRARLEAYGAGLAAKRRDADDARALAAAAAAFTSAVASTADERERLGQLFGTNAAFHGILMETGRHARLQQMLARAVDRPLIHRSLSGCDLAHLETSARFHELIADAVLRGDAERAERLTLEHVLQARDALVAVIADEAVEDEDAG